MRGLAALVEDLCLRTEIFRRFLTRFVESEEADVAAAVFFPLLPDIMHVQLRSNTDTFASRGIVEMRASRKGLS